MDWSTFTWTEKVRNMQADVALLAWLFAEDMHYRKMDRDWREIPLGLGTAAEGSIDDTEWSTPRALDEGSSSKGGHRVALPPGDGQDGAHQNRGAD